MTRLAAAIVKIADRKHSKETIRALAKGLRRDDDARRLFEDSYAIADRFNFSPAFLETRQVEWLGTSSVAASDDTAAMRADHFLVEDGFHATLAVHQHLALRQPVDLTAPRSPEWRAMISTLHQVYWPWNWLLDRRAGRSDVAEQLDPLSTAIAPGGELLFASRSLYISAYDADASLIRDWRSVAPALRSLLYLQSEGAEVADTAELLEERMAQSTEFFVSFFTVDSLVSVSTTFPPPNVVRPFPADYPFSTKAVESALHQHERRMTEYTARYEAYDLLPEYPALRYLDLAVLEFATNAEYGQWDIRSILDRLTQSQYAVGLLRAVTALPRIDRLYYRTSNLSVLRLPVVRELAGRILAEQALGANERAIDGMRASLLNLLVTILTVTGLSIGLIQLALALL